MRREEQIPDGSPRGLRAARDGLGDHASAALVSHGGDPHGPDDAIGDDEAPPPQRPVQGGRLRDGDRLEGDLARDAPGPDPDRRDGMGDGEVQRAIQLDVVQLSVGERAQLEGRAGPVTEGRGAVAAEDLDLRLVEPAEARRDRAQRVEVAQLEAAHVERRLSLAQTEVAAAEELHGVREERLPGRRGARREVGPRVEGQDPTAGEMEPSRRPHRKARGNARPRANASAT